MARLLNELTAKRWHRVAVQCEPGNWWWSLDRVERRKFDAAKLVGAVDTSVARLAHGEVWVLARSVRVLSGHEMAVALATLDAINLLLSEIEAVERAQRAAVRKPRKRDLRRVAERGEGVVFMMQCAG